MRHVEPGLGHRLHPAGKDQICVAQADEICGVDHRHHRARADHVNGVPVHLLGNPRFDRCLARHQLAVPRAQHVAQDIEVQVRPVDAGALQRRAHRVRPQLDR